MSEEKPEYKIQEDKMSGKIIFWNVCSLCGKKTPNIVQGKFCCINCHFIYVGFNRKKS